MALERRALLLALLGMSAFATGARAEDVAVDGFSASPDQLSFTSFAGTRTPGAFGVDTTLWLDYGLHTLEKKPLGLGSGALIDHRLDATLALQLGIMSRGAIALRVPMLLYQDADRYSGQTIGSTAFGNPALDGRVRVWGAKVRPDGSVQDGGAVALRGIVQVPVKTTDAFFAENTVRAEAAVISDIEMLGIGAGLSLGYRLRFDDVDLAGHTLGDQLRLAAGLRLPLPLVARAYPGKVQESALVEFDMGTDPKDLFERATMPVELRFSYRIIASDFFATLGAGAGLVSAIGSPDLRVLAAFGWSPRKHDQDADGVPDDQDQCAHLPEDRDGFEDEDGCADDDNDGDLIVDEDDRCPLVPAEVGRDDDEDGCTDG